MAVTLIPIIKPCLACKLQSMMTYLVMYYFKLSEQMYLICILIPGGRERRQWLFRKPQEAPNRGPGSVAGSLRCRLTTGKVPGPRVVRQTLYSVISKTGLCEFSTYVMGFQGVKWVWNDHSWHSFLGSQCTIATQRPSEASRW